MQNTKKYRGVYKDSRGNYYFQTELGVDPVSGKRIQKKSHSDRLGRPFKNARDAYSELLEVKTEFNRLYSHDNYNMTFSQFMNNVYLVAYKEKVQSVTYKAALSQHKAFIEKFGNKRLKDITPRECELYRLRIIQEYSQNYSLNLWSRFKACLGYAERLGYISSSPCRNLENPKGKHPDTKFWRNDEFLKVIEIFDLSIYSEVMFQALTWCCFIWGTRVGEILALKWKDVNIEEKYIYIHATLERDERGLFAKEGTKTKDSTRYIDCDNMTLEILKRWRMMEIASENDNFVFSLFGKALDKSTFTRMLKRHAKSANVPEITGKGLRHSNNTYLRRELGKSSELVSIRSGRKPNSRITDETYTHFYHKDSDNIADEIVNELLKASLPETLPKMDK